MARIVCDATVRSRHKLDGHVQLRLVVVNRSSSDVSGRLAFPAYQKDRVELDRETAPSSRFGSDGELQLLSVTMPKDSSSILELARRGAQHRYEELQAELRSLVQHFPDLRSGARTLAKRGRRAMAAAAELRPRRRRRLSAAARAKISAAQRARWAKQKGANDGQAATVARKAGKKR